MRDTFNFYVRITVKCCLCGDIVEGTPFPMRVGDRILEPNLPKGWTEWRGNPICPPHKITVDGKEMMAWMR